MNDYFKEWQATASKAAEYKRVLEAIYGDVVKEEPDTACNVCSTYKHKHWCWYPLLARAVAVGEMDKFDSDFCEKHDRHVEAMQRAIYD